MTQQDGAGSGGGRNGYGPGWECGPPGRCAGLRGWGIWKRIVRDEKGSIHIKNAGASGRGCACGRHIERLAEKGIRTQTDADSLPGAATITIWAAVNLSYFLGPPGFALTCGFSQIPRGVSGVLRPLCAGVHTVCGTCICRLKSVPESVGDSPATAS